MNENVMTTSLEIIDEVNCLAADLYLMHGKVVCDGARFNQAEDGTLAKQCWNAAVIAYHNRAVEIENSTKCIDHVRIVPPTGLNVQTLAV